MSFKVNPLSALGRLGYAGHLLFYPLAGAVYVYVVSPYLAERSKAAE